jgi:hypothetical protein
MKHIASRLISPFLFSIVLSERVSFCSKVDALMQYHIELPETDGGLTKD